MSTVAASEKGNTPFPSLIKRRGASKRFLMLIPLILAIAAEPASVTAIAQNGTVKSSDSFQFSFFNECTGEVVSGVVNVTTILHISADANGGFHAHLHDVFNGRAVGETSGLEYVGPQTDHDSFTASSGGTVVETFTLDFRFLSRGGLDNILSHVLFHITIGPNGDVTREFQNITTECRG